MASLGVWILLVAASSTSCGSAAGPADPAANRTAAQAVNRTAAQAANRTAAQAVNILARQNSSDEPGATQLAAVNASAAQAVNASAAQAANASAAQAANASDDEDDGPPDQDDTGEPEVQWHPVEGDRIEVPRWDSQTEAKELLRAAAAPPGEATLADEAAAAPPVEHWEVGSFDSAPFTLNWQGGETTEKYGWLLGQSSTENDLQWSMLFFRFTRIEKILVMLAKSFVMSAGARDEHAVLPSDDDWTLSIDPIWSTDPKQRISQGVHRLKQALREAEREHDVKESIFYVLLRDNNFVDQAREMLYDEHNKEQQAWQQMLVTAEYVLALMTSTRDKVFPPPKEVDPGVVQREMKFEEALKTSVKTLSSNLRGMRIGGRTALETLDAATDAHTSLENFINAVQAYRALRDGFERQSRASYERLLFIEKMETPPSRPRPTHEEIAAA